MPNSPKGMSEAVLRNLEKNTGKSLKQWITLLNKSGATDHKEAARWIRENHGLGGTTIYAILSQTPFAPDWFTKSSGDLLQEQYVGKENLRAIYDKVVKALGKDVEVGARKTYMTFSRGAQFALVQPTTKTRSDLCLRLPGVKAAGRLQPAGSAGSGSITHRVALTSVKEVDAEVTRWIKQAYELRGKEK